MCNMQRLLSSGVGGESWAAWAVLISTGGPGSIQHKCIYAGCLPYQKDIYHLSWIGFCSAINYIKTHVPCCYHAPGYLLLPPPQDPLLGKNNQLNCMRSGSQPKCIYAGCLHTQWHLSFISFCSAFNNTHCHAPGYFLLSPFQDPLVGKNNQLCAGAV